MKATLFLIVCITFQNLYVAFNTEEVGVNISFKVTRMSTCRTEKDMFRRILGVGLPNCVRECGLRSHCEALCYRRKLQGCDLFTTRDGGSLGNGYCIFIAKSEIKVQKTPCGTCSYGQMCDMHTKQCKYKECIPTHIKNGTVLGNLNEIGSKIRYKCNHGYRDKDGIKSAVCKDDGTWNVTANCTRANVGCYTVGYSYLYEGTRQHSQSGIPCQRWDAQSPHGHTRINPANFPEDTLSAADHYCRDPDSEGAPWCYTIDPSVRFQFCGVQPC